MDVKGQAFYRVYIVGRSQGADTASKLEPDRMSYERSVLSHLESVQQLPLDVQADIARRVDNFIKLAKAAKAESLLERLASVAMEEQAKAIGQGVNSTMDPRWAAPALAEAWCYATIGMSAGNLDRSSAEAIIGAIEAFASRRASR